MTDHSELIARHVAETMARAISDLWKARIQEQRWEPANDVQEPTPQEEAQAALKALSEAGYVVVPREPTEAMLGAGEVGLSDAGLDDTTTEDALLCWTAMIEAAGE